MGTERLRVWLAYLTGVSFAYRDGSVRVYQAMATKHAAKGASRQGPGREDLYAGWRQSDSKQPDPTLVATPWCR